jgi:hypothetical protein
MSRVSRVIDAAARMAWSIILSLFYQRQDQYLQDEIAVRSGVVNVVNWLSLKRYENVILEIANEYGHSGFDHEILKTDSGVASLIRLAQNQAPQLLLGPSGKGGGTLGPQVASASDILLIHFNSTPLSEIKSRVEAPILWQTYYLQRR